MPFLLVSFSVEVELLLASQVPRGTRNYPHEAAPHKTPYLRSADSGLQLDLEIALGGVPAKVQPHGRHFSPAEDALKRRMT